ncbi:hypothetical protein PVAND_016235 [Polypedilum vanderplanki]|uniref:Uncharacterized protein n=1 Tax=Polypedilum vanderplanki TaxID=319348 RepID=A0A9J6BF92_POLVA|nr:hypothetical protein PVAND_016235 [Polypedilum vanderplanki]
MKFSSLFAIFIVSNNFVILKSFTINCVFKSTSLNIVGNVYQCQTTNIPTSCIFVTKITGAHQDGKNNIDVESLWIQGNYTLSFVPRNFSFFFPFLRAISIWYSSIEILYGDEFDEFDYFDYISIQHSYLKTISSRLFESSPQMVHVYFGNNMVERVGNDLFTPLDITQLQVLGFTNNPCIKRASVNSQADIISYIDELREKCPFVDEFVITSTIENLHCLDENIQNLVCNLKDSMSEIQEDIAYTKNQKIVKIESELIQTKENFTKFMEESKDKLNKSDKKVSELEKQISKLNEELQAKVENIELMKLDFEVRLKNLEEEILSSASYFYILNIRLFAFCTITSTLLYVFPMFVELE